MLDFSPNGLDFDDFELNRGDNGGEVGGEVAGVVGGEGAAAEKSGGGSRASDTRSV